MLENFGSLNAVDFSVDLSHESYGNIGHEVKDVNCSPRTLTIKIGGIGPLMGR
jgi:hypothetical protein